MQTGFCSNSNCTAIFVGSTLVAGTIISIMTCGVCVYRYKPTLSLLFKMNSMRRALGGV